MGLFGAVGSNNSISNLGVIGYFPACYAAHLKNNGTSGTSEDTTETVNE